jgi:hypothetical protein
MFAITGLYKIKSQLLALVSTELFGPLGTCSCLTGCGMFAITGFN